VVGEVAVAASDPAWLSGRADAIDEVVRLKKETDGDLSVGGAG
jgi:hypothetical protein